MIPSFMSVEAGERDLRLKREPFELERPDADGIEERRPLSRPGAVIQLVERHDGALRHARYESLERALRRFVEIEIQVQERDDEVWVQLEVFGNRLQRIAFHELDFRNVSQRAIEIEDRYAFGNISRRVGRQATGD